MKNLYGSSHDKSGTWDVWRPLRRGISVLKCDHVHALEAHLEAARSSSSLLPAYLVVGKESDEWQEAIDLLLRFLVSSRDDRQMTLFRFDAAREGAAELGERLYSPSFFSPSRVIWIQGAERLSRGCQELLGRYLISPIPLCYVILSTFATLRRLSCYPLLERAGMVFEVVERKHWEKQKYCVEWLGRRALGSRKRLSLQAIQALVNRTGSNRALLEREWEKLLCYCGERDEITLQDIERLCPPPPAESAWQLGEALFRRDAALALQIARSLCQQGEPLLPLLRQLRSQFQTGCQMSCLMAEGRSSREIGQEFPRLKGTWLERNLRQAERYGVNAFKKGLLAIDDTSMRLKSGIGGEGVLLELLMLRLTQVY